MNSLQMVFFKVEVDEVCRAIFADEKDAQAYAKKLGGEVQRTQSIKIAKIFDIWS